MTDDATGPGDGEGADGGLLGRDPWWTPDALRAVRGDPRRRAAALAVAAAVGLGAAWLHWLGLFVAGGLVGLVSRTLPRAVLAGLAVGGLAVAVTVLTHPAMAAGEFLALTPPAYVAVAAGVLAPAWGALVRGVV